MTEETSASVEQAPQDSGLQESSFSVPETYAEKGWAQNIKSHDDLWSQFANAQELIGKRPAGIPTSESPEEDWNKFYQALGRPDDASGYELSLREGLELPEGIELGEYENKAREFFHKLGLPADKANEAWNDYLSMELESVQASQQAMQERQKELDAEYDKLTQELYGEKYGEVEQSAINFINEALPENLRDVVPQLAENPKALLAMVKLADFAQSQIGSVKKEYGAEDKLATGVQANAATEKEVIAKLVERKNEAKKAAPFSPERKRAEEEINKLREQLTRFYK